MNGNKNQESGSGSASGSGSGSALLIEAGWPITEAQKIKMAEGRIKYGPFFVGHPLAHLYEELIDSLNYIDEAREQGYLSGEEHQLMEAAMTSVAVFTRGRYHQRKNETIGRRNVTER